MFKQKLARVIENVQGSIGCMLIGLDGIAIDKEFRDQEDPQVGMIAVELSNLLDRLKRMEINDDVPVNEIAVTAGDVTMLAHSVGGEYLLILAMHRDADINRGQTMLRLITPFIEREIN